MDEQLSKVSRGWKVWKNPSTPDGKVEYLNEVYPPEGQFCLTGRDLTHLGFTPGEYTVLAPEGAPRSDMFGRWQRVFIPKC